MALLGEKEQGILKERFAELDKTVNLICFTQEFECQYCNETRELLEELAQLSDKIDLQIFDFQKDEAEVKKYNIDKIPATVVAGDQDYGIRYFGIPAGYEFSALIENIMFVSKGQTDLSDNTRQQLNDLSKPIHIQVFVTPT